MKTMHAVVLLLALLLCGDSYDDGDANPEVPQ